jgi:hypothetical protein
MGRGGSQEADRQVAIPLMIYAANFIFLLTNIPILDLVNYVMFSCGDNLELWR